MEISRHIEAGNKRLKEQREAERVAEMEQMVLDDDVTIDE